MSQLNDDDVVISGISGVFPKSNNIEEFAEKLFTKENLLSDVPYMPVKLGKLNDLSKFDADFFGFHQPHRVNVMDPMARIILEKTYEALIDSGNNPVSLKGQNCGVYIGVHSVETEMLTYHKIQKGAYLAQSRSFLANRISFWLGIHGPSYTIDSACSSTLLAIETAYKAIRSRDCDSAIVGGCQICLHPAVLLHLLKVGALNPKGESRIFDENAGGFCKGECIGVFYLERARNAKRVYARIIKTCINHDGQKPLFLSPWSPSQAQLLRRVYLESNISVDSVEWIETHATGTLIGDKQEVDALDSVFNGRRDPLLIGSVKSNMGHAEAAAGVCSISKVIIAMETGFIPPNINLKNLRQDIKGFRCGRIKVITDKIPWKGGLVGISGFGMGGVNCHIVLESSQKEKINHGIPNDNLPRIVGISGRTEEAVNVLLRHLEMTPLDSEFVGLLHEIYKLNIPLHPYRGLILLPKNERCKMKKIEITDDRHRKILFVFSSIFGNWNHIYRSLIEVKVFQQSISRSSDILANFDVNLMDILNDCSKENILFQSYVCSVVLQMALYDLMCSLDCVPNYIIGYSIGELVCAYADGCLKFEETITATYYCALFLSSRHENSDGIITVVADTDHSFLDAHLPNNFQLSFPSILSGPESDVFKFLHANKITYSRMESFKSVLPKDNLQNLLQQIIIPKRKTEKWITWMEKTIDIDAKYFVTCVNTFLDVSKSVEFFPADVILVDFVSTSVSNMFEKSLKGESFFISLINENGTVSVGDFLLAVGELHLLGKNLNFGRLYPPITFPVSRGTKMIAPLIKWKHTSSWPVAFSSGIETLLSGERNLSISLDEKQYSYLVGHEIDFSVLFPGSGYLVLVWETLALIRGSIYTNMPIVFENIRFLKAVTMSSNDPAFFEIMIQKGTGLFEITEKGQIVVTGRVYSPSDIHCEKTILSVPTGTSLFLDKMDFYRYILIRNFNYRGLFRSISRINSEGTKARISWVQNWITFLDGMLQMSILHDTKDGLFVVVEIEKIVIDTNLHNELTEPSVDELDAIFDKKSTVIECGGVQIKGLALRSIVPKPNKKDPLLQKYYFSSFNNEYEMLVKDIIYLFSHVIMDYLGQQKQDVKIVEILDEPIVSTDTLISSVISSFAKEQHAFKIQLKVYTSITSNLKELDTDVAVLVGNLPLSEQVHVIVCKNALNQEQKLKNVLNSLQDDGFILCCEKLSTHFKVPSNLVLCSQALSNGIRYVLLKKKPKAENILKLIKISYDEYSWIKELQDALKVDGFDRIILYAQREFYSGIVGFFNSLRLERNTEHVRCFLLMDDVDSFSIDDKFFKDQLEKDLAVNIFKDGAWGCYVRQPVNPLAPVDVYHTFLKLNNSKIKSSLQWTSGPIRSSMSEDIFHVYYAAINYIDVLLCKKIIPIESILDNPQKKDYVFGIEFSGRSSDGKRYMGLRRYGCLSSHLQLDANGFLNEVPNNWSLEDAVTVPLAYYTVIYAIVVDYQLTPKETILIHSVGSPIGQAAINIATYFGSEILVTVSSIDEELFVKENFPFIPISNIINIANSSFLKTVHEITNGIGVNIILDSLPVDQFSTNVECLARNGRYIQLKRVDLRNSNLNTNKLLSKNISLRSALLDDIFNLPNCRKIELQELVDKYVKNNAIKPLFRTVYSHEDIENAFDFAASPRNFGKCILQIEPEENELVVKPRARIRKAYPRFYCEPEKSFVVCGGSGGMGMELVNWLINCGAKKVVIASRRGEAVGSQILRINRWKSHGVNVVTLKVDISDEKQVESLLDAANLLGTVSGIFNLAGVLEDKIFKNHTVESFTAVAGPKFYGTLNLDKLSRIKCPHLERFVVFSSVSSGFGNLGQTNYALFNSITERICERRRQANLPALAVEWGAVGNVGMLVSLVDGNMATSFRGLLMQPIKSCFDALDQFLCQENTVVTSCVIAD